MALTKPREDIDSERRAPRGRLRRLASTALCWTRDGLILCGWPADGVSPGAMAALSVARAGEDFEEPRFGGTPPSAN